MNKIIILILLSQISFADVIIPANSNDLKITIYNDNRGFVSEKREAYITKGKQKLIYEGIPTSVITQSVIPTFTKINTTLYSQNFAYDLISLNSMLEKSIDKKVYYYANNSDDKAIKKGVLLAVNPILIKTKKQEIITLESSNQIIFTRIPKDMITKPSLIWNIKSADAGKLAIDLKYLTTGIRWQSDYVLNLSDDKFNLKGWITINNNSGASYKNADISVITGEVNKVQSTRNYKFKNAALMESSGHNKTSQESFSGYHLYKIPFREDINNKEQKQIVFLENSNIKYTQYGVVTNNYFANYSKQKLQFNNIIEFKNSKNNNMGLPLPAGTIRMYKKSSNGQSHFIGETSLKNTPKNETIKLTIGKLFDVVGDKKIIEYKNSKHFKMTKTQYEIRNQGERVVTLKIKETLPRYRNNIKTSSSCNYNCKIVKIDAFNRVFVIKVKPSEKYIFTSKFEVNL